MSENEKILVFDLETIPNRSLIPFLPEVKPAKNLKDPVKIQADIDKKLDTQIKEMNLTPALNIICSACGVDLEGTEFAINLENEESEKELLLEFWHFASKYDKFVTFGGRNFDCRCLLLHGMRHGVRPPIEIDASTYNGGNHYDMRQVLSGSSQFAKGNLEFYAQIYLKKGKKKGIDGSLVESYWDLGEFDMIEKYCLDDCQLTKELFEMAKTAGMINY